MKLEYEECCQDPIKMRADEAKILEWELNTEAVNENDEFIYGYFWGFL